MSLRWEIPNLRHLSAVVLVSDAGSISGAAQEMHLSQPAVTQAVARIERLIEARLFHRHATGTCLTPAGEIVCGRLRRALAALAVALSEITGSPACYLRPDLSLTASQLRTLLSLSSTGSFPLSASQLAVSTPYLQRTIHELEASLRTQLVVRSGPEVVLTPAARLLVQHTKLAVTELDLARHELGLERGSVRGRISLGSMPMTRTFLVPQVLVSFTRKYPDICLRLVEGAYTSLLQALREGDIDVLVGALRQPPPHTDVVEEILFAETLCVVARTDHPLESRTNLEVCDLLQYPWIMPREGSPARIYFDEHIRTKGAQPNKQFEVSSHVAVRAILSATDSLALMSRQQVRYEWEEGSLCVLSITLPNANRMIGYTVRSDWLPTRMHSDLIELLCGSARNMESSDQIFGKARHPQCTESATPT